MATFSRVIQISDLHFGHVFRYRRATPARQSIGVHDQRITKALSVCIKELCLEASSFSSPAQVVVTGDISSAGAIIELDTASTYLRGAHYLNRDHADAEGIYGRSDILIIPGNHDVWDGFPRKRHLNPQSWGHFPSAYPSKVTLVGGPRRVVILGLSSALPLPLNFAWGWVSGNQLRRLPSEINAERTADPGTFFITALHHSLLISGWHTRLLNFKSVVSVLLAQRVPLVICGHEHTSTIDYIDDAHGHRLHVSHAGATTIQSDDPRANKFKVYDVYPTKVVVSTFAYDATSSSFDAERLRHVLRV